MFISNNRASSHLWGKKILLKHQKVSKYYESGCSNGSKYFKRDKKKSLQNSRNYQNLLKPFLPNDPFLQPLQTSKKPLV